MTNLYSLYLQHPTISTDTRNIAKDSIFFALKGANFNGNTFAAQALALGAAYVVVDEKEYQLNDKCILVKDVLTALQDLAKEHRTTLNIPIIGITGSNGKTTSKELLNAVLSRKYKTLATKGNLNNHIGVPLTLLSITADIEIAIIEMGANHQREITFLSDIANPTYGLICNVGKAHLEGMGGFEGVKKTKKELYDHIRINNGTSFINADDINLMEMSEGIEKKELFGSHANARVCGRIVNFDPFLSVEIKLKNEKEFTPIQSKLVGDYNLNNILASICIGNYFEVSLSEMVVAIEGYEPSNNRSQAITMGSNHVIMDAYNANPSSMAAAVQNFSKIHADKKMLILGDMFEMGEESMREHLAIIELIHHLKFEQVVFVGKDFYACKKYEFHYFETTDEAKKYLQEIKPQNSHILVKGSRGMKLETIVDSFNK
jgi:UDP-N-acetylmuramoyl-tripeptide--D-alanyl-D-alanine ligase